MMTLENEKRFLLLLSSFALGSPVTKKEVLDYLEQQKWIKLNEKDMEIKHNRNELVWRNDLAFVRKHLEQEGLFVSNKRNDWSITEKGKLYLSQLYYETVLCHTFSKIQKKAISDAKYLLLK
ncbi:MAG: winged helix-turn-helix domain-containing protein [Clostridia bacterium]|nr:winged helix-turn-helix domain-containing protein [Clostridia bacterium]